MKPPGYGISSRVPFVWRESYDAAAQVTPPRCFTCHWWGLRDSESVPEVNRRCHRYPPIGTRGQDGSLITDWPWTGQSDYCGEHKQRLIGASRHVPSNR